MADTDLLAAHLWDLRAQAEARLRRVTRVQQLLADYERGANSTDRTRTRQAIIEEVSDIAALSDSLRDVADAAVTAAMALS